MQPVSCGRCQVSVRVEKNSPAHTSIQWEGDSSACAQRAELAVGETCPFLSDSIRDAVFNGALEVGSEL